MGYDRVLFVGSKKTGLMVLKTIYAISKEKLIGVVTIDDRLDTRSAFSEFERFCQENMISLSIINDSYLLGDLVGEYKPDICFVVGWYRIIPKSVISKVRGGFVGVHYSLLPAYRGCAPVVWSILNGEKRTGLSVFSFDEGMDTGDIWYQAEVEITENDYIEDVLRKLDIKLVEFFRQKYLLLMSGDLQPYKQAVCGISYGAKRGPADGKINWNESADRIHNFVRGQSEPYPGAFTLYDGNILKVWRIKKFEYVMHGYPGQVAFIDKGKKEVVVVCGGNSAVIIGQVEKDGKKYWITDFVRSLEQKFL